MRALYRVLLGLWETPAAEVDPEAWATRFAAHMGLSAGVTIALLALLPDWMALTASLTGYAAMEWSQWRLARGWLLAADCVLDWCAWATVAFATWHLYRGDAATAAALMLVALVICAAGGMEAVLTALEIDKRISLGNVLVVCGMIVSMSMGWANLSSQNSKLAADMEATSSMARANEARVRALENQTARQDERLSSILASLAKIEKMMEQAQAR